ncbi:hypothetical protein L596_020068 [Steinernema carpocapsae]|uniref:Uncharacterized protein n=1 Tax=Steinernema carpocapsae TaxID=34508 RepID=A0A4U5MT94_STECR|nr:hypothetical protein L596_020068 [Steinernema carpocapsae]
MNLLKSYAKKHVEDPDYTLNLWYLRSAYPHKIQDEPLAVILTKKNEAEIKFQGSGDTLLAQYIRFDSVRIRDYEWRGQ